MRMRRFGAVTGGTCLLLVMLAAPASAAPASGVYQVIVGDGELNDFSQAGNGDVVEVAIPDTAGALMNADTKAASGTGTFTHRNAAGQLLGTAHFTLDRLIVFDSYGCGTLGGDPIPPDFCGGRALLAVTVHPDASPTSAFAANLEVNCQVGSPPSGPHHENEGIKLNIKDVINFNRHVPGPSGEFGENIFIKQ